MATNPERYRSGPVTDGFSAYAAGNKSYGLTGRSAPNIGPVGDLSGYRVRDRKRQADAHRNALLKQLQSRLGGNFLSSDSLKPVSGYRNG